MIPHMNIIAWTNEAPWAALRQVEQDLIIGRAVIDIFNDDYLREELRFRGGTALNKLHFPEPLRYSEDIDLVRTSEGPIGPVLDRLRVVLDWLGQANYDVSPVAPSLIFRADAEDGGPQLRLKVEINTREREAHDGSVAIPHAVENPWFTGQADIATFTNEEMLATKLRALLERDKGRDLFDLAHALGVFDGLDTGRVATLFIQYLNDQGKTLSRAQAEQRMLAKLTHAGFLADIKPLLSADDADALTDEAINAAFMEVFIGLIAQIPGAPWANTDETLAQFGLVT
jgi:predicted nucleotidyltransferase component of viral defense system